MSLYLELFCQATTLFRHHESELQLVHGGQWVQGAVIAIKTDTWFLKFIPNYI